MSVTLYDQKITMSSREIAELTVKRHDNVIRDVRNMLTESNLDQLSFEGVYIDTKDKDLALSLVSGYYVQLRMAIIKRWQAIEKSNQFKIPQTPSEALLPVVEAV